MGQLFSLFIMFAKLCVFAFGGGYVMIPNLIKLSEANGWASAAELTDVIAIAGMSPGPVAVNAALGYGYKVAGIPGAVASFLGIAIPCTLMVIIVAAFFFKAYTNAKVQAVLYGINPVMVAIILYAAVNIAMKNGMMASAPDRIIPLGFNINILGFQLFEAKSILLAVLTFAVLVKTKIHPVLLIAAAGVLGVFIF